MLTVLNKHEHETNIVCLHVGGGGPKEDFCKTLEMFLCMNMYEPLWLGGNKGNQADAVKLCRFFQKAQQLDNPNQTLSQPVNQSINL